MSSDELVWKKPGPGSWTWDQSHFAGAPTPLLRRFALPQLEAGLESVFERSGIPMRTFAHRIVNGRVYRRPTPLVGRDSDGRRPPAPVLWLAFRLHPKLRRRNRQARRAFAEQIWNEDIERWRSERPRVIGRNLALQDEDLAALDDGTLADHLGRSFRNACDGYLLHFELRAANAGPIGDLLIHCKAWGIPANEMMEALAGASPASAEPAMTLRRLAELVGDRAVQSIDDVRALGQDAADALDAYLREHGWRMVTSYDIDGRALVELPNAVLTSIRALASRRESLDAGTDAILGLRERVPPEDRSLFDELVGEARAVYGIRDDNGTLTVEWPTGLLRRAVVEAGRRLAARGCLADPEHACELDLEELEDALRSGSGPDAAEVAARARRRAELASIRPPLKLGEAESPPPEWVLPKPIRRTTQVLVETVAHLEAPEERAPLAGVGIGTTTYRGRARVATRPEDVLDTIEQGDVLVTRFTTPAYNTLLFVSGAVVCEEGGALSHAAIIARELGIPAVVGAAGAMAMIHDGDTVEVDPVRGSVRVD